MRKDIYLQLWSQMAPELVELSSLSLLSELNLFLTTIELLSLTRLLSVSLAEDVAHEVGLAIEYLPRGSSSWVRSFLVAAKKYLAASDEKAARLLEEALSDILQKFN